MIDLHNHILPGIDDGSRNLNMTGTMVQRFAEFGFTHLIATPHLQHPLDERFSSLVAGSESSIREISELNEVRIDLGYEHVLSSQTTERLQNGEPSTLAGSFSVLLETPGFQWPTYTESTLFDLQVAGYQPILAHPERYEAVQSNPELALRLADRGIALQLTTASLVGALGRTAQQSSRMLLDKGLARQALMVLSSDAHSAGDRLTSVPAGLDWIRQHYTAGDEIVHWLTHDVPEALLDTSDAAFDRMNEVRNQPHGWHRERVKRRWRLFRPNVDLPYDRN